MSDFLTKASIREIFNSLIEALIYNDLDEANAIIKTGIGLHLKNENGKTALMIALIYGRPDQANALIDAGVDLNVTDKDRRNALIIALVYGRLDQANALIDAGVDLNVRDKDGRNAFIIALVYGRLEIIKKIKETNSSFNLFLIIIGMTGEGLNIITQMDSFVEVITDIRDFMQ